MGTPDFAVPSLRVLAHSHEVVAVYTRPDAVSGRGSKTRPSAVSSAAEALGIPVLQPRTLRDETVQAELRALAPDLLVVAAYGLILPIEVLGSAPLGAVNVHASLLPRWRGAAPVQHAILAGDEWAGVSIMRMEEGLDTGPFCTQASIPVGSTTARELTSALADLGAQALDAALRSIADGGAQWVVQDNSLATYASKITKDDVAIGPELSAEQAARRVRASMPASPSKISLGGRGVTLLDAIVAPERLPPAALACSKLGLLLGVSDGAIMTTCVKPDGKAEMDACAWARGVRDLDTATWERAR
jgi:methionyl-tRNA formyltransferase